MHHKRSPREIHVPTLPNIAGLRLDRRWGSDAGKCWKV